MLSEAQKHSDENPTTGHPMLLYLTDRLGLSRMKTNFTGLFGLIHVILKLLFMVLPVTVILMSMERERETFLSAI